MKVRCIDPGDIQNLQKDKIYEVKELSTTNIYLLDRKARAQYSLKRFNLINDDGTEIYLKDFTNYYKNNNKISTIIPVIFRNNKVKYSYKDNSYLISFRDKLCDINEIFMIISRFTNKYGYLEYKIKSLSKHDIIYITHNQIHTNFYNIDKNDAINMLRRTKILKIKDKI